jgi:hypothetical protein
MNDFVEQCRAEWRRLGVDEPLAEEMATDLASDLAEAAAEGLSVEEYLGSSAEDARSFAASWAAERGLVPSRPSQRHDRRTPRVLLALTTLAAIALIGAVLLLVTGEPKLTLRASRAPRTHLLAPPGAHLTQAHQLQASAAAPIEWMLLILAAGTLALTAWLWLRWNRSQPPPAAA